MKYKVLETRKKRILEAVIRSYVKEAVPVSSSFLVQKCDFKWSSATIRNVMAQLEKEGFLKQPHTSAGRVPTDKGYRYYVDNIIKPKKPSFEEENSIRQQYISKGVEDIGELIEKTTHIICAITNEAALAMMPRITLSTLKKINFLQLDENRILVVLLNSSGMVKNVIINLPKNITRVELQKVENLLNSELKGHSLISIKDYLLYKIKRQQDAIFNIVKNTFEIIDLIDATHINNKLFLDGLSLIMDKPEFKDIDKSRGVLHILEAKTEILEIMNEDLESFKKNIRVHIGSENIYKDIQHCSLITSKYWIGNRIMGSLGVIGPTRMPYDKVISMLECVSHVLSDILTESTFVEDEQNDRKKTQT